MRRPLVIGLCIVLLIALAVPVFAAGSVALESTNGTVYRNGTFTVFVGVSGWGGCTTGSIEVSHDGAFELTAGEWTMTKPDISYFDISAREGGFGYSSSQTLSGNIAKLTFKVKSNAAFTKGKITVNVTLGGSRITKTIEITVACNHQFSKWANYSATVHLRKCSICAKTETVDHVYDHDCDTTCNDCGAERTTTHKFEENWTSDDTGHWHACSVCGEKDSASAHTPGEEAGEYTDQVCTVCKYVLVPALGHTHRYDDTFQKDGDGHWQVCIGCNEKTEAEAHGFDGNCDETCDQCGFAREVTHPVGDWEQSDTGHWKTCPDCSKKLLEGEHEWDAGYVEIQPTTSRDGLMIYHCKQCMAERQETMPKAAPTDPAGGWAWWIWLAIGAGGGVVLTAIVFTLIIVLNVKKKSKGRFSN